MPIGPLEAGLPAAYATSEDQRVAARAYETTIDLAVAVMARPRRTPAETGGREFSMSFEPRPRVAVVPLPPDFVVGQAAYLADRYRAAGWSETTYQQPDHQRLTLSVGPLRAY